MGDGIKNSIDPFNVTGISDPKDQGTFTEKLPNFLRTFDTQQPNFETPRYKELLSGYMGQPHPQVRANIRNWMAPNFQDIMRVGKRQ